MKPCHSQWTRFTLDPSPEEGHLSEPEVLHVGKSEFYRIDDRFREENIATATLILWTSAWERNLQLLARLWAVYILLITRWVSRRKHRQHGSLPPGTHTSRARTRFHSGSGLYGGGRWIFDGIGKQLLHPIQWDASSRLSWFHQSPGDHHASFET